MCSVHFCLRSLLLGLWRPGWVFYLAVSQVVDVLKSCGTDDLPEVINVFSITTSSRSVAIFLTGWPPLKHGMVRDRSDSSLSLVLGHLILWARSSPLQAVPPSGCCLLIDAFPVSPQLGNLILNPYHFFGLIIWFHTSHPSLVSTS